MRVSVTSVSKVCFDRYLRLSVWHTLTQMVHVPAVLSYAAIHKYIHYFSNIQYITTHDWKRDKIMTIF